jgi:hypothetical protein
MFGHRKQRPTPADAEIEVEVHLESEIHRIEQLVIRFLSEPRDETTKNALLVELEWLDDRSAAADSYQGFKAVWLRVGELPSGVIGATSDTPFAEEVSTSIFSAQVALVRAAKNALGDQTPETVAALQQASDELARVQLQDAQRSERP